MEEFLKRNMARGRSRGSAMSKLRQHLDEPGGLTKSSQETVVSTHESDKSTKDDTSPTRDASISECASKSTYSTTDTVDSSKGTSGYGTESHTSGSSSATASKVYTPQRGRGKVLETMLQSLGPSGFRGRNVPTSRQSSSSSSGALMYPMVQEEPKTRPEPIIEKDLLSSSMENLDLTQEQIKTYAGKGGTGLPMNINCIRAECKHSAVYQYHVSFSPQIDSKNFRHSLLNQNKEIIGQTKAFDGAILFLPKRLPEKITEMDAVKKFDGTPVKIKVTFTRALDPASPALLPVYNIILRKAMHNLGLCPVGRNYFDPREAKQVPTYHLSLWPGFVTSIKRFEGGLMLNIDLSHKVLRDETVINVMKTLAKRGGQFRDECFKELIGETVLTKYNNKNYKVDDIDWNMNPNSKFTTSKGGEMSFVEYYQQQYKIQIKDFKQPMLISRPKKKDKDAADRVICLVPELCHLTGISERIRTDYKAMKEIRDVTSLSPSTRNDGIVNFIKKINSTPLARDELQRWGINLQERSCSLGGRVLRGEKLLFGNRKVVQVGATADFSGDAGRCPVLQAVDIQDWSLVFVNRDKMKANSFSQKLLEVSRKLGIKIVPPKSIELRDDKVNTYVTAISSSMSSTTQLVVCIFPTSRDDRYNAFKRLCCVDKPVPSQAIISRTIPDGSKIGKLRSVVMKIAMQINCKMGGQLWACDIPLNDLMVCGIDVYHDPTTNGKSVAALVVSTNKSVTQWFSIPIIQQKGQEIMDALKTAFVSAIGKWHEINHKLPRRIVVFRDGVGDGRLQHVVEHEVEQIKSCFSIYDKIEDKPYEPKLTFIVVSKRIGIKLFSAKERNLSNPPPGTVVDHTVTKVDWHDFFLVSQHVRHGTVSPTHYIVVSGSEYFEPDHVQRLTYKLTHMYYNWPGTVRVPAPCQYAHKLAYLVGENIMRTPSNLLWDRLFYL